MFSGWCGVPGRCSPVLTTRVLEFPHHNIMIIQHFRTQQILQTVFTHLEIFLSHKYLHHQNERNIGNFQS